MTNNRFRKSDLADLVTREDSPLNRAFVGAHHSIAETLFWETLLERWDAIIEFLIEKKWSRECRDQMRRVMFELSLEDLPPYVGRSFPPEYEDTKEDLPLLSCTTPHTECRECMWLAEWRLERGR